MTLYAVLCYAMICCAMLYYATLCYAMLCYAVICYAMVCHAIASNKQAIFRSFWLIFVLLTPRLMVVMMMRACFAF